MICKQPPWILKSLRLQLSVPFPPEPLETAPATSYSWSMAIQICPPNSKSSLQIWFSLSCPTSSIQYRFHDGIQWQIGSNRSIFWTGTGPGERQDQRHKIYQDILWRLGDDSGWTRRHLSPYPPWLQSLISACGSGSLRWCLLTYKLQATFDGAPEAYHIAYIAVTYVTYVKSPFLNERQDQEWYRQFVNKKWQRMV